MPVPTFYLTMKIHKTPWSTRPIVSCSGSLLHSLGTWVEHKLQVIATQQRSFIWSSEDLRTLLTTLQIPPSTHLFTIDTESIYTNIDISVTLHTIATFLHQRSRKFKDTPIEALSSGLAIFMQNNVFKFGDTI